MHMKTANPSIDSCHPHVTDY